MRISSREKRTCMHTKTEAPHELPFLNALAIKMVAVPTGQRRNLWATAGERAGVTQEKQAQIWRAMVWIDECIIMKEKGRRSFGFFEKSEPSETAGMRDSLCNFEKHRDWRSSRTRLEGKTSNACTKEGDWCPRSRVAFDVVQAVSTDERTDRCAPQRLVRCKVVASRRFVTCPW